MVIEWDQELQTGIEHIDDQHREIIQRINQLVDLFDREAGVVEVDRLLRFLGGYVLDHFKAEEDSMIKYKYPDFDFHKEQHAKFLKELSILKRLYEKEGGTPLLVMAILYRGVDWLKNHILTVDKEMAAFLKKKVR